MAELNILEAIRAAMDEELERDPHPLLARLRESEPVSWLPVLDGWLVTRRDLALEVMRDAETYTVDDPRFSTGQVVGPSMLSLDGAEHDRPPQPPHLRLPSASITARSLGAPLGTITPTTSREEKSTNGFTSARCEASRREL